MPGPIHKLIGANMDIDLTSTSEEIGWSQDPCPWNQAEGSTSHKCALKNISICPYFCGVEYLDQVLCCFPDENPYQATTQT